jgi:hypothetical protein
MHSFHVDQNQRTQALRGLLWVLVLAVFAVVANAQFETATLTGTVTDAAGALVPRATVRAINESTNVEAAPPPTTKAAISFPACAQARIVSL